MSIFVFTNPHGDTHWFYFCCQYVAAK